MTCDVDQDGTEADGTVRFGLDGHDYEIELCADHLDEFNERVRPYAELGRRTDVDQRRRRSPRAVAVP
ncbi:MAG: Lsr2 dimerization domain-containing protein, partial [Acidimicrobiales bacterium]